MPKTQAVASPAPSKAAPTSAPVALAKTDSRRLQTRRSGVHGKGVFALMDLAEGEMLLEYAGELRAMQENWPKIKFHALREHAGLVFQKQLEA